MSVHNQPTKAPTSKVVAGAIGGAVATLSMGALAIVDPEMYQRVPPGFEGALAVLLGTMFAYFKKEKL